MFKKIAKLDFLLIYTLVLSTLIPLKFIINPNLYGEDEVLTFNINLEILNFIKNFDFISIIVELIKDWHPPGRNVLSSLTLLFMVENISSARFTYYIIWIISCLIAVSITRKISNNVCGFICATILCGSGLFHVQIMSFGLGAVTFFGLLMIKTLLEINVSSKSINQKNYLKLMTISFFGFIFFNTFLPIVVGLNLFVIYQIIKKENPIEFKFFKFFILCSIFSALYISYYFIFLGLPYLVTFVPNFVEFLNLYFKLDFGNWDGKPFGQLWQYIARQNTSELNFVAFSNNFKYLNWHFFPWLGVIVFLIGIVKLFKRFPMIFYIFLPYGLVVNFYMYGNTAAHSSCFFIWVIPFFASVFSRFSCVTSLSKSILICFAALFISYTSFTQIRTFDVLNFPYNLVNKFNAKLVWPPNIYRPLDVIADKIKTILEPHEKIIYSIDGALPIYYLKEYEAQKISDNELSKISKTSNCKIFNQYKIYISYEEKNFPCSNFIYKKIKFRNSDIIVFELQ